VLNKSHDEWITYLIEKAKKSDLFPGFDIIELLTA
jgi:hypothetical protein